MGLVEVVGSDGKTHRVPEEAVELLHDGRTGEPISDAEYDETKARYARHGEPWPFDTPDKEQA